MIPASQGRFRKLAGADCGADVFTCYRHDENLFAAAPQHFLGDCPVEAIPRDQEPQRACLAPVLQLKVKDDEFVFSALACPVLAFGKNQSDFAAQARLTAVIEHRAVVSMRKRSET